MPQVSASPWKPQVHFVWDVILNKLLPDTRDAPSTQASFGDFFRVVVDGLFNAFPFDVVVTFSFHRGIVFFDGFTKFDSPGSLWSPADTSLGVDSFQELGIAFGLFMAGVRVLSPHPV